MVYVPPAELVVFLGGLLIELQACENLIVLLHQELAEEVLCQEVRRSECALEFFEAVNGCPGDIWFSSRQCILDVRRERGLNRFIEDMAFELVQEGVSGILHVEISERMEVLGVLAEPQIIGRFHAHAHHCNPPCEVVNQVLL